MNSMKLIKRWGIVTLLFAAIVAAPVWLSKQNKVTNKEVEDKNEARDAAKYLWDMRVNPATGKIDVNDVETARKQVDAMIAAKKVSREKSNSLNLQWNELGPDNIGGRTRAVLFDKSNPDHMFAGGVGGGLWESTTHGASWTKYNDTLQNIAVSCITQAANGDIYFGTGEGLYGYYGDGTGSFPGQGVWKSTDHGVTFHRLGSTWDNLTNAQKGNWETVNNIYADPNNASRIYAATGVGLQMSNNGGLSWSNPILSNGNSGNHVSGFSSTVKVGTDGTVLCTVNNLLYISNTGDSATFTKVNTISSVGRVEVAIAPSNPNVMYACVGNGGTSELYNVYRTTDKFVTTTIIGPGGGSFSPLSQESYANSIAVAPNNQDIVFCAGLTVWKWQNGFNWNRVDGYYPNTYVHADQHTIVFNPNDPNDFFIGCDGGLFESQDQGATFSAMNRLYDVTQFYSVTPVPIQGSTGVIGGTQDNGSLYLNRPGYSNTTFSADDVWGGDGAYTAISTYNPSAFFYESEYAYMGRSSNSGGGGNSFYDANISPPNNTSPLGYFVTPFLLWENLNPNTAMDTSFFIGLTGAVWMTKQALDFSSTPKWYEIAITQGQGQCMAITADGKSLFVGTTVGKVYRISNIDYVNDGLDNSGTNYNLTTLQTPIKNTLLSFPGAAGTPTSVTVDQNNGNHVIVTFGGYDSNPHVYVSTNALSANPTFTSLQSSSLPAMPVYSSVLDKWNPNIIMVGTEEGLFTSTDSGATWSPDLNGFPRVPIFMLKQLTQFSNGVPCADIYAGTHGRGIWKTSSLPTGINAVTASDKPKVSFFPNPAQDVANIHYTIKNSENIVLDIYNVDGQKVNSITLGNQGPGSHYYTFNVVGLATGTYFATLVAGNQQSVTKFVIER